MKKLGLSQFIKPSENSTLFITEDKEHKIEIYELPILNYEGKIVSLVNPSNNDIWDSKAIKLFKIIYHQLSNTDQIGKGLSLDKFKELLTLENLEKINFIELLLKLQKELKREISAPKKEDNVLNSLGYQFAQELIKDIGIDNYVSSKLLTRYAIDNPLNVYLHSLAGWGIQQGSIIQQEIDKNITEIVRLTRQYYPNANIDKQHIWNDCLKLNTALDYEKALEQQNLISICLLNKLEKLSNQVK